MKRLLLLSLLFVYMASGFALAQSDDATLREITVSDGTLTPTFDPAVLSYEVNVPSTTNTITVRAVKNDPLAKGADDWVNFALRAGETSFLFTVIAENGSAKAYTVKVIRAKSTDATLSDITVSAGTLSPAFNPAVLSYIVNVPNTTDKITIRTTKSDVNATPASDLENQALVVGDNEFPFTVTAEDGSIKTYTVKVIRAKSDDATLSNITVSAGVLSPTFNSSTLSYTVDVPTTTTKITVKAIKSHAGAEVTSDFIDFDLQDGVNNFAFVVKAQDETTKRTYAVKVVRTKKTDANLRNITLSTGTLSPSFNSNTISYTVNVPTTTSSITIRSVKNDADATVTADFVSKALTIGDNTFTFTVTAQDGSTKKTYTVKVVRAKKTDATLSKITVSAGTLSPVFKSDTLSYKVNVPSTTTKITLRATKNDADATVTADLVDQALKEGNNTFTFTVTAQDGATKKTYTVKVIRGGKTDATLKSLTVSTGTLSPVFNAATLSYTVSVPSTTTSITIRVVKNDVDATAAADLINQTLREGDNTFIFTVTAQDGATKKNYTVKVTRGNKTDATLNNITLSIGTLSPKFSATTYSYSVNVQNSISSMLITGIPSNTSAKMTGSGVQQLKVGRNTIKIVVTAEDGVTKKTYTIDVNRAGTTVGVEDTPSSELKVYPTLTSGSVYIETTDGKQPAVEIYTIAGKLLQKVQTNEANLAGYPKGIYILRVDNKSFKIVKQ